MNTEKLAKQIIAEESVHVHGYGVVSREWLQSEIKKRLEGLKVKNDIDSFKKLRHELYTTGVLKAFLDTEIKELEKNGN